MFGEASQDSSQLTAEQRITQDIDYLDKLLSADFNVDSINETHSAIEHIYRDVEETSKPDTPLFDIYSGIANLLPEQIRSKQNHVLLDAIQSDDPNLAHNAKELLIMLNIKSVLSCLDNYRGLGADFDNELIQQVLTGIAGRMARFDKDELLSHQFSIVSKEEAVKYVQHTLGVENSWVRNKIFVPIVTAVDILFERYPQGIPNDVVITASDRIAKAHDIKPSEVSRYIRQKNDELTLFIHSPESVDPSTIDFDSPDSNEKLALAIERTIDILPEDQKKVITDLFLQRKTLKQIGLEMDLVPQRILQLKKLGLSRLKNYFKAKKITSPQGILLEHE